MHFRLLKDPTAIYWTYINNRGVELGRNAKSTEDLAVLRLACPSAARAMPVCEWRIVAGRD